MAHDNLKTPEQYAKHFGKSKQRVYQLIKADERKATWIGGTKKDGGVPFIDLSKYPTWEGFAN